jgi:hypothetical protein
MKKVFASTISLALMAFGAVFFASPAQAGNEDVTFCHNTAEGKYEILTLPPAGVLNGHVGASHQGGLDVIPAFEYRDGNVIKYFDGQNLDKSYLLTQGCKENATPVSVTPNAPTYEPPTCQNPNAPWGQVNIPGDLGNGVASTTPAVQTISPDGKTAVWKVTYTLEGDTEEHVYTWADGNPERTTLFSFDAVHISTDPLWVIDSKTGKGRCELSNTGASINEIALIAGGGAVGLGMIFLGTTNFIARRRNA